MTDYHPLIARAVEGLGKSTGEARRALYERARSALVTQLRSVEPALAESEITKERLALEDAIRKVEADAARKSRAEPREPRPAASPPRRDRLTPPADAGRTEAPRAVQTWPKPAPDEPGEAATPRPAPAPTARERLLSARAPSLTQEGIKGFRDVVSEVHDLGAATAKAAQSARDTRDSYGPVSSQHLPPVPPAEEPAASSLHGGFEPQLDAEELSSPHDDSRQMRGREPSRELEDEQPAVPQSARHPPHTTTPEEAHEAPRPPRSYRGLIKLLVVLIILAGAAATLAWQWPNIMGVYHFVAQLGSRQPSQATHEAPTTQPKFSGRVPQEQSAGQVPSAGKPGSQTAPAVAQRVVLYEEDPNDPQGKRYVGSAIWRTETVSPGPGLAPELAVRADLEIPERRMTVTWSLRRNTDQALPASHTIEIMFNLPADFPGGGIANVPGVLMKQSEQARGTPLAGLAVKVTNGFFLIGLSAVDSDVQRNVQLLKDRPWFDIPIVYTTGGRAILAMEKGPPGERAFAEAFAAWEKK
jgi:hypothetical protein